MEGSIEAGASGAEPGSGHDAVPDSLRRAMGLCGRVHRFTRGRTIIGEGQPGADVLLILEGRTEVKLFSAQGREVAVRRLAEGDLFGELAALDRKPRSATVVAATDVRVLRLRGEDFLECLATTPGATLWLTKRLGAEVRRLTERVFELSALNVQSRIHCELLRMARAQPMARGRCVISPAPTHAELATRVGTHREAVTRELRDLSDRALLRSGRRSLEFLDIAGLEEAVGLAMGAMESVLCETGLVPSL